MLTEEVIGKCFDAACEIAKAEGALAGAGTPSRDKSGFTTPNLYYLCDESGNLIYTLNKERLYEATGEKSLNPNESEGARIANGRRSAAAIFERNFLFVVGRHFYNFIAVSGFVTMAVGGVLAVIVQSELSPSDRKLLNDKTLDRRLTYPAWVGKNCDQLYSQEPSSTRFRKCQEAIRYRYLESEYQRYDDQRDQNKSKKSMLQLQINAKLLFAALVSLYGLVVVAVSSLNTAVLAIERNTRFRK